MHQLEACTPVFGSTFKRFPDVCLALQEILHGKVSLCSSVQRLDVAAVMLQNLQYKAPYCSSTADAT